MVSPDAVNGFVGGVLAGFGGAIACIRFMVRGALREFELKVLIEKYGLVAREQHHR